MIYKQSQVERYRRNGLTSTINDIGVSKGIPLRPSPKKLVYSKPVKAWRRNLLKLKLSREQTVIAESIVYALKCGPFLKNSAFEKAVKIEIQKRRKGRIRHREGIASQTIRKMTIILIRNGVLERNA